MTLGSDTSVVTTDYLSILDGGKVVSNGGNISINNDLLVSGVGENHPAILLRKMSPLHRRGIIPLLWRGARRAGWSLSRPKRPVCGRVRYRTAIGKTAVLFLFPPALEQMKYGHFCS